MKTYLNKIFSITLILLFSCSINPIDEMTKIESFSKVWGFLKYYHPTVAKGTIDWDIEFLDKVDKLTTLQTKQEINNFYLGWINDLGGINVCTSCNNNIPDSLKFNLNLDWIENTELFNDELKKQLEYIRFNRNQSTNYYVSQDEENGNTLYKNEKSYKDSIYPSQNLRLLALSRYWNIVNYFYPYKYKTDSKWEDVLTEMIPKFKMAKDTLNYQLAVMEMCTKINDSHAYVIFDKSVTQDFFGDKYVPFSYKTFEDKIIVTGFYDEPLSKSNDIQYGDVFLSIDGKPVKECIKFFEKYYAASNSASSLRDMEPALFKGKSDSIKVMCNRNGETFEKFVKRYSIENINFSFDFDQTVSKTLDDNIGYVNMDLLYPKDVKKTLDSFKNAKALILDVRNYSSGGSMYEVAKYLTPKKKEFVKFTIADLTYPGTYRYTEPLACGEENSEYYKGKVVLLCNESTQSHAEFTLMALQTAPNVITIGSKTAGADGDVSEIPLPGGIKTLMSGIGVYYPSGKETQRVGIVPDIEVKKTVEGIRNHKDEVLDKALEILNKNGL